MDSHEVMYNDAVGIFKSDKPVEITFRASGQWALYLRSLPIHSSQREMECSEGYTLFTINAAITFDLDRKFLSYGSNVEVLTPASYRERVREQFEAASRVYSGEW